MISPEQFHPTLPRPPSSVIYNGYRITAQRIKLPPVSKQQIQNRQHELISNNPVKEKVET
jgi:hypothetical protein